MEMADEQTAEIEHGGRSQSANAVTSKPFRSANNQKGKPQWKEKPVHTNQFKKPANAWKPSNQKICGFCGGKYPHESGNNGCPAKGQRCHKCGTLNHFARMCRRPNQSQNQDRSQRSNVNIVHKDDENDSDESDNRDQQTLAVSSNDEHYTFAVKSSQSNCERPWFSVDIAGTSVRMMADSGASINILDKKDYCNIQNKPSLEESSVKIFPYMARTPLNVLGKFSCKVSANKMTATETFYVVDGVSGSLMCWNTSQALGLIRVVNAAAVPEPIQLILDEYQEVCTGLGKYKGEPVKIHIDETVPAVAQPHRRIPFHIRTQVEENLKELEEADIIEPVEGPTPWVSPIVVRPKPNGKGIRICVDMRKPNEAIGRERHIIPTVDEIIADLSGATIFSKIDLNKGYHQLVLHPDSRPITTFSTHVGLRRYKRLNFGITSAAEIFQNTVREVLHGLPGVRNISDDIVCFAEDAKTHDERIRAVFTRLRESGLTINLEKCEFRKSSITYFGYIFSAAGISPDPKKVSALQNASPPTNATEVRSLLSSVSFCSRFIPGFSTMTKPLRDLTCKDVNWIWGKEQIESFMNLKQSLTGDTVLKYYTMDSPIEIYVDASPVGLGAVMTQRDPKTNTVRPIFYASRALTSVEQRYSQIEREALAILWSCEKFHLYVYGTSFTVISDHKPLIPLFNNPMSKPPARIEKWILKLQPYKLTVVYEPGTTNPADYLSRHPEPVLDSRMQDENEADIAYIISNAVPKAMCLDEVVVATGQDRTLQAVKEAVCTGRWDKPPYGVPASELCRYKCVKDYITVTDTVVLKDNRIILPVSLQEKAVNIAHEGHQGMVKTKGLLREKVWFPCMDKLVEEKIRHCLPCQIATPQVTREPLKMSPLPVAAWEEISIDFASVSGETVLVIVDDYSRFPIVEPISSTSAASAIPKLDKCFAMFGTPKVVRSDNGPPFNGEDFARFASVLGFRHRKITPLWSRSNGEVERFIKL
jgi:hypothetical protein